MVRILVTHTHTHTKTVECGIRCSIVDKMRRFRQRLSWRKFAWNEHIPFAIYILYGVFENS